MNLDEVDMCGDCGSMIWPGWKDVHEKWHRDLEKFLEEAGDD